MRNVFRLQRRLAGALCALLLIPALSSPASAAGAKPLTSILLVAPDDLSDPDFAGSIVVVMNNLAPAPVGIIINRPTPIPVAQLFPQLERLAHVRDKVYFGGPVELDTVWFLFRAAKAPAHSIRVCDGVYVSADAKLLLQLLSRDKPMDGLRIFVGHAGWAPGQLQSEIERGDWTPRRADAKAIFHSKPERPWPPSGGPKRGA